MTKHWALRDAKARLSELVRAARKEPQIITLWGMPMVEVRRVKPRRRKLKNLFEALQSCPYPIEVPPRRREKPRKLDL
jgi:prevent-host-death family protein